MNKLILVIFVIKVVFQQHECQSFNSTTNSQTFSMTNSTSNSTVSSSTTKSVNRLFNESCYDNSQCYGPLDCKDHKCQCLPGYIWSNSTKNCLINHSTIKQCNYTSQCMEYDPNMICRSDGRCYCQIGYQMSQFKCYKKLNLTTEPTKVTTKNPLKTHNAYCDVEYGIKCNSTLTCKYSWCKCPLRYIWSKQLGKCVSFLDGVCYYNSECQDLDSNTICSTSMKCQCKSGYQLDSYSSLCVAKTNVIGARCYQNYDCGVINSYCRNNKCTCKMFYEQSSDSSYCLSTVCNRDSNCYSKDINSHCSYGQCQCDSNYYYTNSKCVRYTYYNYGYDFFWFFMLIPLFGFCICIRIACVRSRHRIMHHHDHANTCHTIYTSSSAVPFRQNNFVASTSTAAPITVSHPPFDAPPKYSQVIANNYN